MKNNLRTDDIESDIFLKTFQDILLFIFIPIFSKIYKITILLPFLGDIYVFESGRGSWLP